MVNLITYSDFTGDIKLVLGTGEQVRLTAYIERYQKELLEMLLGFNLYSYLDENYDSETADKWKDLIDGVDEYFTYATYRKKYTGVKKMIAYYVYFKWVTTETTSQTNEGETKDLSVNGESVINIDKIINAFNRMVDLYNDAQNYIEYKNYSEGSDYYDDYDSTYIQKINAFGL